MNKRFCHCVVAVAVAAFAFSAVNVALALAAEDDESVAVPLQSGPPMDSSEMTCPKLPSEDLLKPERLRKSNRYRAPIIPLRQ